MDFKIIWHNCSPSRVDVPFETFVKVGPRPLLKVKFVQTITPTILDGFQNKFAHLFSIMSRCAIWNICSGRPKVKVTQAQHIVPGQPASWQSYAPLLDRKSGTSFFITQTPLLTTLKKEPFENIVVKEENVGNQHFLLLPGCFSVLSRPNFAIWIIFDLSFANVLNLNWSKIFLFGKWFKLYNGTRMWCSCFVLYCKILIGTID